MIMDCVTSIGAKVFQMKIQNINLMPKYEKSSSSPAKVGEIDEYSPDRHPDSRLCSPLPAPVCRKIHSFFP
jgi:hypothetical protein